MAAAAASTAGGGWVPAYQRPPPQADAHGWHYLMCFCCLRLLNPACPPATTCPLQLRILCAEGRLRPLQPAQLPGLRHVHGRHPWLHRRQAVHAVQHWSLQEAGEMRKRE